MTDMNDSRIEQKQLEDRDDPNVPTVLTHWEELRIRRLWHKLQGQFSTPCLQGLLRAEGIRLDRIDYATLMRIAWEEVFILYGDRFEHYQALKEQVSNPETDWSRAIGPDIVGIRLRDDLGNLSNVEDT